MGFEVLRLSRGWGEVLLQGTDMKIRRGLEDKFLLLSLLNVGMGDSKILGLPVWLRAAQVVRGLSECGKRSLTGGKAKDSPRSFTACHK